MLNRKDLELIGEVINKTVPPIVHKIVHEVVNEVVPKIVHEIVSVEFSEFAIMVQSCFKEIMETKADKADVATKIDIERLENKFEGRIERIEDNIRIVKTKLKIA